MVERRISERLATDPMVRILPRAADGIAGWLKNVSCGGFAMELPAGVELRPELQVLVELPLGRSQTRLVTRATVLSVDEGDTRLAHFSFIDESPIFAQTLDACVEAWKAWGE